MTDDPTLADEIAAAHAEAEKAYAASALIADALEEMGKDLAAIDGLDHVRAGTLTKVRADWDFLKDRQRESSDRLHELANRFLKLQERHLTVVEGEPPPATKETP